MRAEETPEERAPAGRHLADEAPEGKLDLLVCIDFRMTGTGLFSDVLLPAATWYEKHDLSSTDMHPFVHAFTPAIDPPWETKSDHDIFQALGRRVSELAPGHLGAARTSSMVPLLHDTPDEMAVPDGVVQDWRTARSTRSLASPCRSSSSSNATTPPSAPRCRPSDRWSRSSAP